MERGTGTTTRQMQEAPQGSVFVWCGRYLSYPKDLARNLGREDLNIVPLMWLNRANVRGGINFMA